LHWFDSLLLDPVFRLLTWTWQRSCYVLEAIMFWKLFWKLLSSDSTAMVCFFVAVHLVVANLVIMHLMVQWFNYSGAVLSTDPCAVDIPGQCQPASTGSDHMPVTSFCSLRLLKFDLQSAHPLTIQASYQSLANNGSQLADLPKPITSLENYAW